MSFPPQDNSTSDNLNEENSAAPAESYASLAQELLMKALIVKDKPENPASSVVENSNPATHVSESNNENPQIPKLAVLPTTEKQPKTLEDVLKLSLSLQSESSPQPCAMDEEKKNFLMKALENDAVMDVTKFLLSRIEILNGFKDLPQEKIKAKEIEYLTLLRELQDIVCCMDMAKVFYQLGGLKSLVPFLYDEKHNLLWLAIDVILECCKNNPFCQDMTLSDEVFGRLMEIAASESCSDAKTKAISTVSAIVRNNLKGIQQFCKFNGMKMVQDNLNQGVETVVMKTVFLVISLCDTCEELKDSLMSAHILETLIWLLLMVDPFIQEGILRAILSFTDNSYTRAIEKCRNHLELRRYIERIIRDPDIDESYQDLQKIGEALYDRIYLPLSEGNDNEAN